MQVQTVAEGEPKNSAISRKSPTAEKCSLYTTNTNNGENRMQCSQFTSMNAKKTGGKQIQCSKMSDSYAISFPNALPVKQVVWGKDPIRIEWRQCYIIHARLSSNCCVKDDRNLDNSSYDYYVHWVGADRRLDCWLSFTDIREMHDALPEGENVCYDIENHSDDDHAGMDEEYLREHEEATKVKTIGRIKMGNHFVDTWYFSPYPKDFQNIETLYICEFCLTFFRYESEMDLHSTRCECQYPPGNEIYRENKIAMFEIDGNNCRIYCENLCFLSKLFLDHKTLRHPVNLFLFYVMTEVDDRGHHIAGYFSKEKYSRNNVSCILTLPQHQRKGYGKFLINFSYSLSKIERKAGTPERPLSDLGKAIYMTHWTQVIISLLHHQREKISVKEISEMTSIETSDIISCLEGCGILKSKGDCFFFFLPPQRTKKILERCGNAATDVDLSNIHWTPYDYYLKSFEFNSQA